MKTEYLKRLCAADGTKRSPIELVAVFAIVLSGFASTVSAHHSWRAVYNEGRPVSVTAVITGKPYRNPHDRVDATIVNEAGEIQEWAIEWRGRRGGRGSGRGEAIQYDLNAGDEVTIEGVTARDPSRLSIQMTKLTRISDGLTIEASLGRRGNGEGRGEGRRDGRDNRRNQSID